MIYTHIPKEAPDDNHILDSCYTTCTMAINHLTIIDLRRMYPQLAAAAMKLQGKYTNIY